MIENTELNQELVRAQMACRIAAICMYAIAAVSLFIDILYFYTLTQTDSLGFLTNGQSFATVFHSVTCTALIVLLAEFLRNFCKGSPFGKAQSLRLFVAGLCLAAQTMVSAMFPSAQFEADVAKTGMTVASQADIDLKVVAMIVFLIALSLVMRYGHALKEDSDSIL